MATLGRPPDPCREPRAQPAVRLAVNATIDRGPSSRSGALASAGASLALHVALGAAFVLAPGPASSFSRSPVPISDLVLARLPTWVPIEPEDEPFPEEPEGGNAVEPARTAEPATGTPASRRPGHGLGRASGDARGNGPPTHATVTMGEPDVRQLELGIPRAEILRTLRDRADEVRRCTPRGRQAFARVVLAFNVGADGFVTDARIASSTLADTDAESCMTAAVRRWTFPAAPNGGSTRFSYPFVVGPFDVP